MLFEKKKINREIDDLRSKVEEELEKKTLPMRLIVGLLTPFIVVALFLFLVSKQLAVVPPEPTEGANEQVPMAAEDAQMSLPPDHSVPLSVEEDNQMLDQGSDLESSIIVEEPPRYVEGEKKKLLPTTKEPPSKEPSSMERSKPALSRSTEAVRPASPRGARPTELASPPPATGGSSGGRIAPMSEPGLTFFKSLKDESDLKKEVKTAPPVPSQRLAKKTETPITPVSKIKIDAVVKAAPHTVPLSDPKIPERLIANRNTGGKYAIQVGSFQQKEDAERLMARLKQGGHDAYIVLVNIPNRGTWYRVWVGHYPDRSLADAAAGRLSQAGHLGAFVAHNE